MCIKTKMYIVQHYSVLKPALSKNYWLIEWVVVDIWWGVWRCTHAKLAPLTPHPLARDRHYRPASGQRGERFEAGNLSAPISPLLLKCVDSTTTLSLCFGIDQDLRISGLDGKLAAGCLRSGLAWIVFCFHCWVADCKNRALGAGWRRLWAIPVAPALSPSCGALSERQKRPPNEWWYRWEYNTNSLGSVIAVHVWLQKCFCLLYKTNWIEIHRYLNFYA